VTSRHPRAPHPVPISQRHRLMSFTANGIERHFSKRKRDVKAFLFVQTNRDVTRCDSETRLAILSKKIRRQRNYASESMCYAVQLLPVSPPPMKADIGSDMAHGCVGPKTEVIPRKSTCSVPAVVSEGMSQALQFKRYAEERK